MMQRVKLYGLILLGITLVFFLWFWSRDNDKRPTGAIQKFPARQEMGRQIVGNVDSNQSIISNNVVLSQSKREEFKPKLVIEPVPVPVVFSTNEVVASNIQHILAIISNTFVTVDDILKTKDYKLMEFSRTYWIVAEDPQQAVTWRLYFGRTNSVCTIEKDVYQDEQRTTKDMPKSYSIVFHMETNVIHWFSWRDDHEVIYFQLNGKPKSYALDLGNDRDYEIKWDEYDNIVSEKVTDWSKRGQPIGNKQDQQQKIPSRLYPTSSIEAATESWRQKQE